jgi:DNA recombination protein RmuC
METVLLFIVIGLLIIGLILVFVRKPINYKEDFTNLRNLLSTTEQSIQRMEFAEKEEFRQNRKEISDQLKINREEMAGTLKDFRGELLQSLKNFQESFDKNVKSFNDLQKEKFGLMETKQNELIQNTEKKLEKMRETVDEKLQKTLNERLGQSFELVSKQLKDVEQGLGEMKTLAQDVGGLKKVLSNVKMRGGIGEVQLAMLLEQVLAPEQYEANVRTKQGSNDIVEFAIKLPGRDMDQTTVYLPIDAKFPKDVYEQLVDAYDSGDPALIDTASKNIESVIKKMAKDIRDKYLDPPNTTDFGIMFLPFEGIYAEVVRRATLLEQLQREFKVVVTGPTTLAAILNSLQMGFRTLAIQQRSGEVWKILGAVKKEFENFGGMLEKAHKEITKAGDTIEELRGKRTRAITRKLKEVEALPAKESREILPEIASEEVIDEEESGEIK